jgi:hypothetical protein
LHGRGELTSNELYAFDTQMLRSPAMSSRVDTWPLMKIGKKSDAVWVLLIWMRM